jgi:hypothetical protein
MADETHDGKELAGGEDVRVELGGIGVEEAKDVVDVGGAKMGIASSEPCAALAAADADGVDGDEVCGGQVGDVGEGGGVLGVFAVGEGAGVQVERSTGHGLRESAVPPSNGAYPPASSHASLLPRPQ